MKRKNGHSRNIGYSDRKEVILQQLMEKGAVSVSELSKRLSVTPVTARADLAALEQEGLLVRTHGGAQLGHHPKVFERMQAGSVYKEKIARAAADLIENGDTVIVTSGTTTALISKYLLGKRDIHIVTNNTLLLTHARNNPQVRVTLIGGEFRPEEEGLVGPMALAAIEQFHVSKAFIGIDGASLKQGFTAHTLESAVLVHKMAEQADQVVAIAHSGKFGKHGFARILPFGDVDVLVTDKELSEEFESKLSGAGVRVVKSK
ncbi:MAG: DeoR/GlpR transcriptional regulator [Gammaproteobacteria bacterium]|nr:DeoR/GlpR transcriptional regulator [Gammaproteobacteria bacterium]